MFTKIFQNVKILILQWNILQYLTKLLRWYFNCNERLEIFLAFFCNILCYVGTYKNNKKYQKNGNNLNKKSAMWKWKYYDAKLHRKISSRLNNYYLRYYCHRPVKHHFEKNAFKDASHTPEPLKLHDQNS